MIEYLLIDLLFQKPHNNQVTRIKPFYMVRKSDVISEQNISEPINGN